MKKDFNKLVLFNCISADDLSTISSHESLSTSQIHKVNYF